MNKIKAIFYDLDNTLYPQINDVTQRIDYCIKEFFLPNPDDIRRVWIDEWLKNGPLMHNLLDKISEKFSLGVNKEELLSAYRACNTNLYLEEDARRLLLKVKGKGIKQFLITNGYPQTQLNKIRSLRLEELFDEAIVATGEYSKPSDYWFKKLLKKHNLAPEESLSVGDWYMVDGLASISAGIPFLHIGGGPVEEDIPPYICRLNKLKNIEEYLTYEKK